VTYHHTNRVMAELF